MVRVILLCRGITHEGIIGAALAVSVWFPFLFFAIFQCKAQYVNIMSCAIICWFPHLSKVKYWVLIYIYIVFVLLERH